ncbi:MAG: DUF4143 domain-containing protein [Nitrospinae bacterium]|nr:DUF4143 domain-containing protein [Nitrospinota bacterium]
MPEVVSIYRKSRRVNLCQQVLDDLLFTIQDDFAKYKKRSPVIRLKEVFDSIAKQSGGKFMFSRIESNAKQVQLKNALELLIQAGLAHKAYHTAANGIPLGAEINTKTFKVILFDIGLHQRVLNLNIAEFALAKDFAAINKGQITEVFVGMELIKNFPPNMKPSLYYWHRLNSSAEVDYVIQDNHEIIPIEVKSGTSGQMQSMHLFMKEKKNKRGYRISLENFSKYNGIEVIPLYATHLIVPNR